MTLDLAALKAKLNTLQNKQKISDILWKPTEGTTKIRIVPLQNNPENPFIEAWIHFNFNGKTFLSPKTFGESDPIEEFGQSLRNEGGGQLPREEWEVTKKFFSTMRTYVPVVVRGKEEEGVKFWGFGKTVLNQLLTIMTDDEYGDITDIRQGLDIKVTFTTKENSDTNFPKTDILVTRNNTPLTDSKELAKKLLTEQPNFFDYFDRPTYEELQTLLTSYITPAAESSTSSDVSSDWDDEKPTEEVSQQKTPPAVVSKESDSTSEGKSVDPLADFEALFNNE